MIQTRSHIKETLFSSSQLFSTSSDYLSTSSLFPSPRKSPLELNPTHINNHSASRFRKSSTSLQSSQTIKTKKSFSSQTGSQLQKSAILKKALTLRIDNDTLKEKQEMVENYRKRIRDLKSKKARLGEEVRSRQIKLLKKSVSVRDQINQYFNKV